MSKEAGIAQVVRVIKGLLPFAEKQNVILAMENHYKDSYWRYPEFAQSMEIFTAIIGEIDSPWLGVNFDPSNTLLAGEDPLEPLERVKHRVVSMHASDRYLTSDTLQDLRREEEDAIGYARERPLAGIYCHRFLFLDGTEQQEDLRNIHRLVLNSLMEDGEFARRVFKKSYSQPRMGCSTCGHSDAFLSKYLGRSMTCVYKGTFLQNIEIR
jgi:hypothetical protein